VSTHNVNNSYIAPTAQIGEETIIGHFCVIQDNVCIGKRCSIANFIVIYPGTVIGDDVTIQDYSVIGKPPMRSRRSAIRLGTDEAKPALIGSEVRIGAHTVVYNQTDIGRGVLIADSAQVRERVKIDEDSIVGRLVTVENDVVIGKRVKLETGCYITAYSEIGNDCFIAPMVATSNDRFIGRTKERYKYYKGVTVKDGGRICVGAVMLPGVVVGEEGVVAGGSVVSRDVPPKAIVMGVPARYKRDVPPEQWVENQ